VASMGRPALGNRKVLKQVVCEPASLSSGGGIPAVAEAGASPATTGRLDQDRPTYPLRGSYPAPWTVTEQGPLRSTAKRWDLN
jgi:hypothetical protein